MGPHLSCVAQRIVDARTGETVRLELLTRLQGAPAPRSILGVLRRMERAARFELALWQLSVAARLPGVAVSVNLDPSALVRSDWTATLLNAVEACPTPPVLELTEHEPLPPPAALNRAIDRLRRADVRVALDDFGAGFSRDLSLLERYAIDIVKLDRGLTAGVEACDRRRAALRTVIEAVRALGRCVVAEGVETEAQATALLAGGAHLQQGYWHHRPEPIETLERVA